MNSRSCSAAFVAILTLAAGGMAHAQTFSLDVGVASQYVGKGLGKSDEEVAPFAKAEMGYGQAYANLFVSSASGSQGFDSEIVTTLGWRPEAAGFALDVAAINRELPGARAGVDSNFWEYQADAARKDDKPPMDWWAEARGLLTNEQAAGYLRIEGPVAFNPVALLEGRVEPSPTASADIVERLEKLKQVLSGKDDAA